MITVRIYNQEKGGAFTKDSSSFEVEEFTIEAIVAEMQKRKWGCALKGRFFFAAREDPAWVAGLLFKIQNDGWRGVQV